MEKLKEIGLVLNIFDVQIDTPMEIIPGCSLRRPKSRELTQIKRLLEKYDSTKSVRRVFEFQIPKNGGNIQTLPTSSQPYWVVEETSPDNTIGLGLENVCMISRLSPVEFRCSNVTLLLDATTGRFGWSFSQSIGTDPFVHLGPWTKPLVVDSGVVQQIRITWDRLQIVTAAFPAIALAVKKFHHLGAMWKGNNDLYTLGVFGVIESILTHDPEGRHDSLKHQISTKMALLNSRFETPVDYSCFGSVGVELVWQKLYGYRSALAHGQPPDFENKLQLLKDKPLSDFLESATKAFLRHALKEPTLVLDLQKC